MTRATVPSVDPLLVHLKAARDGHLDRARRLLADPTYRSADTFGFNARIQFEGELTQAEIAQRRLDLLAHTTTDSGDADDA